MFRPKLGTLVRALLVTGCVLAAATAAANLCHNVWRYPTECQMPNCSYQIAWRYNKPQDAIDFIVSTGHPDRWTGIIFSNDANVSSSDGIFAWVEGNDYVMMDAFMPDFSRAVSDSKQSVTNISAHLLNGIATFKFTRKRDTLDPEDISFADEAKCPYFVFPVDGGSVDHKTRTITTDEHHPYISDRRVCIRACTTPSPQTGSSSTSKPQVPFPSPSRTTTSAPPRLTATSAASTTTSTTTTTTTSTTPKPKSQATATTTTSTTSRPQTTTLKPVASSSNGSSSRRPSTTTTSSTTTTTTTTTTQAPTTLRSSTRPPSSTTSTRPPPSTTTPTPPPPTTATTNTSKPSSTPASPTTTTTSTTTSTTTTSTTSTTERPASDNVASQSSTVLVSNKPVSSSSSSSSSSFDQLQQQTTSTAQPLGANQQWCAGRWAYPTNCRFKTSTPIEVIQYLQASIDASSNIKPLPLELSDCSYFAQWQYLESSDSIEFVIQTKTRNRWTGIGFSNGTKMANSDAIIGLIEEHTGRHFIMDTWLRDHVMPEIDKQQNINQQTYGKRENGTTTVRFRRPRLTGDSADFQFTDSACAYFFFPTQGGSFNAISKRMHKHELVPIVSENKICIRSCTAGRNSPTSTSTTASTGNTVATANSEPNAVSSNASVSTPATSSTSQKAPAAGEDELAAGANQSSQQPKQFLEGHSSTPSSAGAPDKSLESTNPINLAPSNDLSAELDGTSSAPNSALNGQPSAAPTQPNSNPFSRSLAVFSEPSLRWLAGIGCVATLLAMIVFQACFTMYKNKQAYKENLYRQSAFKPNAYLHNTYLNQETGSLAQNYASTGSTNTNSNSSNTAITANAGSNHQLTASSSSVVGATAGAVSAGAGAAGTASGYRAHQHHAHHHRGHHHEQHPLRPHHGHYSRHSNHADHMHQTAASGGPGGAMTSHHRAHGGGASMSGQHALHEPAGHHVRAQHPHYRHAQPYTSHRHGSGAGGRGARLLGDNLIHRPQDEDDLEEEELDDEMVEEMEEEEEEEELDDEELDEEEFDDMMLDEEPFGGHHPSGAHHPYHSQRAANCHHSHQQHPTHSHSGHIHGHGHAPHHPHRHRSPPSYPAHQQPAPSGYASRVHARAQPPYGDPRNMHYEWPRLPELRRSGAGAH